MTKIFISYRREDSRYPAERLFERICEVLPKDEVFMDIDSIPAGVDFADHLAKKVSECDVLICLIGSRWTGPTDPMSQQTCIQQTGDFVRVEIASALERNIPVIPVLLDGAPLPKPEQLPEDLKSLIRRNAEFIDQRSFNLDADRLIGKIGLRRRSKFPPKIFAAITIAVALSVSGLYAFVEHKNDLIQQRSVNLDDDTEDLVRLPAESGLKKARSQNRPLVSVTMNAIEATTAIQTLLLEHPRNGIHFKLVDQVADITIKTTSEGTHQVSGPRALDFFEFQSSGDLLNWLLEQVNQIVVLELFNNASLELDASNAIMVSLIAPERTREPNLTFCSPEFVTQQLDTFRASLEAAPRHVPLCAFYSVKISLGDKLVRQQRSLIAKTLVFSASSGVLELGRGTVIELGENHIEHRYSGEDMFQSVGYLPLSANRIAHEEVLVLAIEPLNDPMTSMQVFDQFLPSVMNERAELAFEFDMLGPLIMCKATISSGLSKPDAKIERVAPDGCRQIQPDLLNQILCGDDLRQACEYRRQ